MEPVETLSVTQAVVKSLMQRINKGTWKAGERLPSQRKLAEEFNVGMSSLREALQTLRGMGVLDSSRGQGTIVSQNPVLIVERFLKLESVPNRDQIVDFLDARRAIEGGLAYLAAKRATDAQIDRLKLLVEDMGRPDEGDGTSIDEMDLAFHHLIAEMSDSQMLRILGDTLFEYLEEFLSFVPHTRQGLGRHANVCQAITQRDPDKSEKAMHDLVDNAAVYLGFENQVETQKLSKN